VVIDSHLHVVNFLQHPVEAGDLSRLLRGDTTTGAVLFGLPVKKKWALTEPWRPTYYLDDNAPCGTYSLTDELVATLVGELLEDDQELVAPLICGFDPTDRLAADHVDLLRTRHSLWRGVGEILLRHDDLTELTYGENARAGHPALDEVLEICAAEGWPFLFHQDASSAGRPDEGEYVGEVTSMLERHPAVAQVWAHAGISRRVRPAGHAARIRSLLEQHANLHIDLSWVAFDAVAEDSSWFEVIEGHPDRFVLGSDAFGDLEQQPTMLGRWTELSSRFSETIRHLVEEGNARRLWSIR
jgi:hypothetical protein